MAIGIGYNPSTRDLVRDPVTLAYPVRGSYGAPLAYRTADFGTLCAACTAEPACVQADADTWDTQWHVIGADVADRADVCDHCYAPILA